MKQTICFTILIFVSSFAFPIPSLAQGMMGDMMGNNNTVTQNDNGHTAREEAEGKEIWEKLQTKELNCEELSADDFGALGEYFMGQMMGDSHEAMNNMMGQMMGKEGEEQIHVAMGKRMSGCEEDAPMPPNMMDSGMMPMMMNMMMGGWQNPLQKGGGNSMMGYGYLGAWNWLGWLIMILFWTLIIIGLIALIKWLISQTKTTPKGQSALEILKERLAKGEINQAEYQKLKDELTK